MIYYSEENLQLIFYIIFIIIVMNYVKLYVREPVIIIGVIINELKWKADN